MRVSIVPTSTHFRPTLASICSSRNAVVVFPFVPVTALIFSLSCCGKRPNTAEFPPPQAPRRPCSTSTAGTSPSSTNTPRESVTTAAAPRSIAVRTKRFPSVLPPRIATNTSPGPTRRESYCTSRTSISSRTSASPRPRRSTTCIAATTSSHRIVRFYLCKNKRTETIASITANSFRTTLTGRCCAHCAPEIPPTASPSPTAGPSFQSSTRAPIGRHRKKPKPGSSAINRASCAQVDQTEDHDQHRDHERAIQYNLQRPPPSPTQWAMEPSSPHEPHHHLGPQRHHRPRRGTCSRARPLPAGCTLRPAAVRLHDRPQAVALEHRHSHALQLDRSRLLYCRAPALPAGSSGPPAAASRLLCRCRGKRQRAGCPPAPPVRQQFHRSAGRLAAASQPSRTLHPPRGPQRHSRPSPRRSPDAAVDHPPADCWSHQTSPFRSAVLSATHHRRASVFAPFLVSASDIPVAYRAARQDIPHTCCHILFTQRRHRRAVPTANRRLHRSPHVSKSP